MIPFREEDQDMSVAIITGASSGLGREFFDAVKLQCPEIDEFWLVARRKDRLEKIAEDHADKVVAAIALDLSKEENLETFSKVLEARSPKVSLLINNAGVGRIGEFTEETLDSQMGMIDLNVKALTAVTHMVLPYMTENSNIINIASIASFCATPGMSVYSSTKAYVLSFSRGLRDELRETDDRKINVTAVCPGPMETEFLPVAGIDGETSPQFMSLPRDDAKTIAEKSLKAALKGKALYVGKYKWYHFLSRVIPHNRLTTMTRV